MPIKLYEEVYYIAHLKNLWSIAEHGILSKTVLNKKNIRPTDISDPDVQRWRDRKEPVHGCSIHDYVPLYFNPLNAMLYKRRNLRNALIIFTFQVRKLLHMKHLFTDGNAASRDTKFSSEIALVHTSDDILRAMSWSELIDGRRRRCAEMLIHEQLPTQKIENIFCYHQAIKDYAQTIIDCSVVVDQSMFY